MTWGTSGNPDFKIDQGVTNVDEATLRALHLPPFVAAIKAGASSVMVSHTTWNGIELAASHYFLTDVLKGELGFKGFVVSDWYGVYEIPGGEYHAAVTAINAGVDMVMLPYDYKSFTGYIQKALAQGDITPVRLDDAVRRILGAKFAAGLFDKQPVPNYLMREFGSAEHRQVAREAVRKSLVLLKDEQYVLPLSKTTPRIVVAGSSANNLGRQSGGWTVEWQGIDGNWIPGITILDSIRQAVASTTLVEYNPVGNFAPAKQAADVGIAVVGEVPYAEGWGDNEHPTLTPEDLKTIARVKAQSKKLIVIIVSGRPLDMPRIAQGDALVAAWLPGTEGTGVTDVLFGDYPFTGTLPVAWPLR
jgi:beta-glucosidase